MATVIPDLIGNRMYQSKTCFVYIVTNRRRGTLYTGVTNDLTRRAFEHAGGACPGFTAKYNLRRVVWFEPRNDAKAAILCEKRIKRWRRAWKFELIEKENPAWADIVFGAAAAPAHPIAPRVHA